jgi:hypothetical protein
LDYLVLVIKNDQITTAQPNQFQAEIDLAKLPDKAL